MTMRKIHSLCFGLLCAARMGMAQPDKEVLFRFAHM